MSVDGLCTNDHVMKATSIFAVILLASSIAWGAETPVLHLTNGGFVPGTLKASEQPAVLRWQSASFTQPFEFSLNDITAIYFPVPAEQLKPKGEYCLELTSGDVLFGELVALTGDDLELDSSRFGRLHVQRDQISRIYRWTGGTELIYLGPNGLSGWKESSTVNAWSEEGGHLLTSANGTQIYADFGIPAQAVIEFEVSWKLKPDFVLDLAAGDADEKSLKRPYRIEVWDNELVACCEMAREADVESLQKIQNGTGRVHLLVYLDQHQGTFTVFASNGSRLASVSVTNPKKQVFSGIRLSNKLGDVRFERLRISRWDGALPSEGQANKPRLHRTDDAILYGKLTGYDPGTKQFSVDNGSEEIKVAAQETAGIFLSPPADTKGKTVRAVYHDCTQISGQLTQIGDDYLQLTRPGIKETLRLPLIGLRSFVVLERTQSASSTPSQGITGRLELEGLRLPGHLVNGKQQADASCLLWHPDQSATASPLRPGISGRIVFREPPPPPNPTPDSAQVEVLRAQLGGRATTVTRTKKAPTTTGPKILHLRSGDTVPCEVSSIDENGLTLTTPLSDAKFVPHDKIKAVELVAGQPPKLTKVKRERLLTLPRGQKDSPPTHLIPFTNGDFLRGRVIDMDDKKLHVEVHLETKEISRDRVAQIIWLHPDELAESPTPISTANPANATALTRVQAVSNGGNRLTFYAEELADQTLSGTSDVLGRCRTEMQKVDQLLIGNAIESAATNLAYHRWKLHHATEPKVAQEAGDGKSPDGRSPGIDAALVGKPAPSFELDLLGGKKFRLAESKGRVVVLDFWATWCGPCLQAMPQVEQVVREFRDQNVQLVAVNLEEPEKQITSTLERHKLELTVALDRDGAVAAKYEASAIPQTVVIDREGKVSRVFVGGGQHLAEYLRESLQQLHAETPRSSTP